MPRLGRRELVQGRIVQLDYCGAQHGVVASMIAFRVGRHVGQYGLGRCCLGGTGFILSRFPDTVRAPDFAFLREPGFHGAGYVDLPAALVVEVVEFDEAEQDLSPRVAEWLAFGVTSVWVADPQSKSIAIHRAASAPTRFVQGETLTDDAVLPEFSLDVAEVFR